MGRHGTIAGRKDKQDAKRAQLFTKYARLVTVAAKAGGDPEYNISLKNAIDKAKAINMPNDNIKRAIKKGTGELQGENYEALTYEGYGPGGVAMIVETLTDNKNRTNSNIKNYFTKNNGNLGAPGCVSYMFNRKGVLLIEKTDQVDEDTLMEDALEAGMDDMVSNEDGFEIYTTQDDFNEVKSSLEGKGYEFIEADVELIPDMTSAPSNEGEEKALRKLVDALEEDDDVQKVSHNCEIELG